MMIILNVMEALFMIAVIIFAHKNFNQVRRLVNSLKHNDVDIFMHVDIKADFNKDDFKDVHVFKLRADIQWGKITKLDTMMQVFKEVLDLNKYDRFIYMSGQDYLLKPIDEIVDFLNRNKEKNYLEYSRVEEKHVKDRYLKYRFRNELLDRISVKISFRKNVYGDLTTYWGPEWWMLTNDALKLITDEYFRFYRGKLGHTLCMDEMIFQTILVNSKLRSTIVNDNKWYVDWSDHINGLNKGNPNILREKDFQKMIDSDDFFARKFDINIDSKILDMLDEHRQG